MKGKILKLTEEKMSWNQEQSHVTGEKTLALPTEWEHFGHEVRQCDKILLSTSGTNSFFLLFPSVQDGAVGEESCLKSVIDLYTVTEGNVPSEWAPGPPS